MFGEGQEDMRAAARARFGLEKKLWSMDGWRRPVDLPVEAAMRDTTGCRRSARGRAGGEQLAAALLVGEKGVTLLCVFVR
jgi:hypothetical protein